MGRVGNANKMSTQGISTVFICYKLGDRYLLAFYLIIFKKKNPLTTIVK